MKVFVAGATGAVGSPWSPCSSRRATNAKARRELGWQPRYASWREGFRDGLGA
jgi:nucleoside-diphosphate-sugar epimerase